MKSNAVGELVDQHWVKSAQIRRECGKTQSRKTPYLDAFYAVQCLVKQIINSVAFSSNAGDISEETEGLTKNWYKQK